MRLYADGSALIKRVIAEAESAALVDALDEHVRAGAFVVSSSLAWIEVARVLRVRHARRRAHGAAELDAAMSGVAEHPITPEVVGLARRVDPDALRSLDAIHLATALLVDADLVLTYDVRLAEACELGGLPVTRPG